MLYCPIVLLTEYRLETMIQQSNDTREQWNREFYLFRYFLGSKLVLPLLLDNSPLRFVLAPPSLILQPDLGLQEVKVVPEKVRRETKSNSGKLRNSLFFIDFMLCSLIIVVMAISSF